jgi:hypothetical protein
LLRLRPFIASAVFRLVPSAIVSATFSNQLAMILGPPSIRDKRREALGSLISASSFTASR